MGIRRVGTDEYLVVTPIQEDQKILGRVINALGEPVDGLGPIKSVKEVEVEKIKDFEQIQT